MLITKNFEKSEFECPCCGGSKTAFELIRKLQCVRDELKLPISVNSSYRCEVHNAKIRGNPHSYHLRGLAVDISTLRYNSREKYILLTSLLAHGFHGIGIYKTFIHADLRADPCLFQP